jgi:hypothetical protein
LFGANSVSGISRHNKSRLSDKKNPPSNLPEALRARLPELKTNMTEPTSRSTSNSLDLEKQTADSGNGITEHTSTVDSKGESQTLGEFKNEETLSRIESSTSAVFDIASRVPTNATIESGIIGIYPTFRYLGYGEISSEKMLTE